MTENDIVFKFYEDGECPDPNCFCHYGWEGQGAFAFWKYACAYYDSAEALFQKFLQSKGDYAILDGIGLTICFLYRHYVELSVKYLFLKFVAKKPTEVKKFLEKKHNLSELWAKTKPGLSLLRKRVGSSVSIGSLEHYILSFDKFDKDEMSMRYPIKKDLTKMHEPTRLDVYNLHDRMAEMHIAFETISSDLDNQLFDDVAPERIELFEKKYDALRKRVIDCIQTMQSLAVKEETESIIDVMESLKKPSEKMAYMSSLSNDEIIMLDTLYYTGRMINCKELRLPMNPHEARIDAIKMCILNMEDDGLEFGKAYKIGRINIIWKSCAALYKNISSAVATIDWDKPMLLS